MQEAVQRMEDSTRKLRAFHFKGILAVMLAACLVVMGGCFSFGWWKLSRHYDRTVDAAQANPVGERETRRLSHS